MESALLFALLTGVSAASYSIFQKIGSTSINPALGAMIVSVVAFTINFCIFLSMKFHGEKILITNKGIWVLVLVGVAAAGIDFFALMAYSRGLKLSSSVIIGGVSVAIVLLASFLLFKESFSFVKLLALGLIVAGTLLLQRLGV